MATTIQVTDDITIMSPMTINGKECRLESVSFSQAIYEKNEQEALIKVMAAELLERKVIDIDEDGRYYFDATGEYLVPTDDE